MNNKRREKLRSAKDHIESAVLIIDNVLSDENDYLDSIPESFIYKVECAENNIDSIEDVLGLLSDACSGIEEICS